MAVEVAVAARGSSSSGGGADTRSGQRQRRSHVRLVAPEPQRGAGQGLDGRGRRARAGHDALRPGLLVAGGAADLAGQEEPLGAVVGPQLEPVSQRPRVYVIVLDVVPGSSS